MRVTIVTIGKPPKPELSSLIREYEKRLNLLQVSWTYLEPSPLDPKQAIQAEGDAILKHLKKNDFVMLLDEHGKRRTSEQLSTALFGQRNMTIIIGGPFGVDTRIKNRANDTMSLSSLVFPHQIVRLMLIEQLYRAESIKTGHPYHHA